MKSWSVNAGEIIEVIKTREKGSDKIATVNYHSIGVK